MKYKIKSQTIPKELRKKINEKIIYIINNNLTEKETGITKNDIFNSYTGRGGLHNLNYKDYSNYYSYKKDKQEIEQGQFFTPYSLVNWIMDCLKSKQSDLLEAFCRRRVCRSLFRYGVEKFINLWYNK